MTTLNRSRSGWARRVRALALSCGLLHVGIALAEEPRSPAGDHDRATGPACTLRTPEAPRGGRVELSGERLGRTPLVLIAGRVAPILQREKTLIAAQVHRDSEGGAVTVKTGGVQVTCGLLTIIGKN